MIDHLIGRPSVSWKRTQVFMVMFFWVWQLARGNPRGPRILWIKKLNRVLARFTPWQILVSSMTALYALRHMDNILGLAAPEPLARLYSRDYYRSTWIATGLDAGFATAMHIQPKWLRDILSIVFSLYYVVYANEADEKLRKYRAVSTVEMLRATWEKTNNPYLRALSWKDRPRLGVMKKLLIARPASSPHTKPMLAWVFFAGKEEELADATDIIFDCPGGGFIAMNPSHHEERLRSWAVQTGKVVLAVDYGKAPEYPYPWAIEEGFDAYRMVVETKGKAIGLSGKTPVNIIMSGDSAGGNLATGVMFKIIESSTYIPRPIALLLSYPALDFNFTSWMTPANLRVLRSEQSSSHIPGLIEQKDHFGHKSPLSVINDVRRKNSKRQKSWTRSMGEILPFASSSNTPVVSRAPSPTHSRKSTGTPKCVKFGPSTENLRIRELEEDEDMYEPLTEEDRPILERVKTSESVLRDEQAELCEALEADKRKSSTATKVPIGTRLTMTSRSGYFQDRIISPSMMRAMAILYIGPCSNPDFQTDYYLSPILAPDRLLVEFPPTLINSGEKDPFVDDTVIFSGRLREAKRARRAEVERAVVARSSRAGDSLRGRLPNGAANPAYAAATPAELAILAQTEEDWVQMRIIEGWSHGYLQMMTLMSEAKLAVAHLADWMEMVFKAHHALNPHIIAAAAAASPSGSSPLRNSVTAAASVNRGRNPAGGAVGPVRRRGSRPPISPTSGNSQRAGSSSSSATAVKHSTSETETTETEREFLTFTPRKKRSPPPSYSILEGAREEESAGSAEKKKGVIVTTRTVPAVSSPSSSSPASSEETLTGTPEAMLINLDGGQARPRRLPSQLEQPGTPKRRSSSPWKKMPNCVASAPVSGSPRQLSAALTDSTRIGTPVLAGVFLMSEEELMKRRRLEAVHGLVAGDGVMMP